MAVNLRRLSAAGLAAPIRPGSPGTWRNGSRFTRRAASWKRATAGRRRSNSTRRRRKSTTASRNSSFVSAVPDGGRPSVPRPGTDSNWPAIWTSCDSAPTPASMPSSARWPASKRPPASGLSMRSGCWPERDPDFNGIWAWRPLLRARPLDLRGKLPARSGRFRPGLRSLAATGLPKQAAGDPFEAALRGIAGADSVGRVHSRPPSWWI